MHVLLDVFSGGCAWEGGSWPLCVVSVWGAEMGLPLSERVSYDTSTENNSSVKSRDCSRDHSRDLWVSLGQMN